MVTSKKIPVQIIGIPLSIQKCVFFRAAVYFVFAEQKLLPKDENNFHVSVEVNQGFKDMQTFFQGHFDAQEIKLKSLKKILIGSMILIRNGVVMNVSQKMSTTIFFLL